MSSSSEISEWPTESETEISGQSYTGKVNYGTDDLADHMIRHAVHFSEWFIHRKLDDNDLIDCEDHVRWMRTITASRLTTHRFLHPLISRPDGIFRSGTLEQFIDIARRRRGEDVADVDTEWPRILDAVRKSELLDRLDLLCEDESRLNAWFWGVCGLIASGQTFPFIGEEASFGLRGALAYTERGVEKTSPYLPQVGYFGDHKLSFKHNGKMFAVVEVHCTEAHSEEFDWFRARSILANVMASLGGDRDCQAVLIICDIGFKLLYRTEIGLNPDGVPIFDYFIYPPLDAEKGLSVYQPCRGSQPENKDNMECLLRLIYELMMTGMNGTQELPVKRRRYERHNLPRQTHAFQVTTIRGIVLNFEGIKKSAKAAAQKSAQI